MDKVLVECLLSTGLPRLVSFTFHKTYVYSPFIFSSSHKEARLSFGHTKTTFKGLEDPSKDELCFF